MVTESYKMIDSGGQKRLFIEVKLWKVSDLEELLVLEYPVMKYIV